MAEKKAVNKVVEPTNGNFAWQIEVRHYRSH